MDLRAGEEASWIFLFRAIKKYVLRVTFTTPYSRRWCGHGFENLHCSVIGGVDITGCFLYLRVKLGSQGAGSFMSPEG